VIRTPRLQETAHPLSDRFHALCQIVFYRSDSMSVLPSEAAAAVSDRRGSYGPIALKK
jgi:hypothetical protein